MERFKYKFVLVSASLIIISVFLLTIYFVFWWKRIIFKKAINKNELTLVHCDTDPCETSFSLNNEMFVIGPILILIHVLSSNGVTAKRGNFLVIDHDGGADDAMAIFMAILYEEHFNGPNVVALTTVYGNVNEPQVYNNTQRILNVANRRDIPIFRGSKSALVRGAPSDFYFGYDGLGDNVTVSFKPIAAKPEHAVLALINLSKKYEGQLSIIALGALTNIALAIKLDCDFMSRLSRLYVAAGNIYSANHTAAEFNAQMDVEAYHVVATEGNPEKLIIIPFSQIINDINISNEWRKYVLGSIPTDIMRAQNVFEQVSLPKDKTWVLLDPAAMAVVLDVSFVKVFAYSNNSIDLCGENRGISTNLFTSPQNATAKMVIKVNEESYKKFLLDVFSSSLH